jgi:predicted RecA/RadA family phage recombinase
MRNYVQRGDTLDITAPGAVASGDVVIKGVIVGISNVDAAEGETFALDVVGVFDLPKVAALAIGQGDAVYWDTANKVVTKTAGGNTKLGVATIAAPNPSGSVSVRLNGAF